MNEKRERDICHLKLMIDYHRHLCILSFGALVLTANFFDKTIEGFGVKVFLLISIAAFFISVFSSILAQIHHIDLARKDVIYDHPLSHSFVWPMLLSMVGAICGVVFLGVTVFSIWLQR